MVESKKKKKLPKYLPNISMLKLLLKSVKGFQIYGGKRMMLTPTLTPMTADEK